MNGDIKIIVATIAFGMGIDKDDVQFVVHYSLPKSLEGYYQESGRAGRNGKDSRCLLMFSVEDYQRMLRLFSWNGGETPEIERFEIQEEQLFHVVEYSEEEVECRRCILLKYFGEKYDQSDCNEKCDNCRNRSRYIVQKEITEDATRIIQAIQDFEVHNQDAKIPSLTNLSEILFPFNKTTQKTQCFKIISKLLFECIIKRKAFLSSHGPLVYYGKGKNFDNFAKKHYKIYLRQVQKEQNSQIFSQF